VANPDEITAVITLELGPNRVPAAEFRKAVELFTRWLDRLGETACGDAGDIAWELSVKSGSLLIEANPHSLSDQRHIDRVVSAASDPPAVLRNDLVSLSRLAIDGLRLWIGKESRDPASYRNVANDQPQPFSEYGTVEGMLSMLSDRARPRFTIYEPIWDKPVTCTVPEELVDRMRDLWRKRVAAHGMVHYDSKGHPKRIEADEVALFPYDETPIGAYRGMLSAD